MIQSGSEIVEVRSKRLARAGDLLVDLFGGGHTLGEIARQSGVRFQELERLTRRLSHLHLLETTPKTGPVPKQRRPSLKSSSRAKHSGGKMHSLLLVGLGELGLTVLDQVLHYGPRVVYIFDPVPVEDGDLAPFYRPGDLGRDESRRGLALPWPNGSKHRSAREVRGRRVGDDSGNLGARYRQGGSGAVLRQPRQSLLAECVSAACDTARVPLVVAELGNAGGSVGPIRTPDGARDSGGCISCASLYRAEGDPFLSLEREYCSDASRSGSPAPFSQPWLIEMISRLALLAAFQAGDRASNPATNASMLWRLSRRKFEVVATAVPNTTHARSVFPALDRTSAELRKQALREWQERWNGPATEPVDLLELRRRSQHLIGERFALFRSCALESADRDGLSIGFAAIAAPIRATICWRMPFVPWWSGQAGVANEPSAMSAIRKARTFTTAARRRHWR